jgi:hypothetical protein
MPVISTGIIIGTCGFLILAFTYNAWMFILGIAVFSIGEMTAHPKYYNYVGIVAPKDNVAVYMGYAFLYGVIGSLFGSNFGAIMYAKILKPVAPTAEVLKAGMSMTPEVMSQIRLFWLIFAGLGIFCLIGMLVYNKFFSQDTDVANKRAWAIMLVVYIILAVAGILFMVGALRADPIRWKTVIQALIMLVLGSGGMWVSLKKDSN